MKLNINHPGYNLANIALSSAHDDSITAVQDLDNFLPEFLKEPNEANFTKLIELGLAVKTANLFYEKAGENWDNFIID